MAEIKHTFKSNCKEISVDCNGNSYLIIFGKHVNGAYCAFPSLGVSAELSDDNSKIGYLYNYKKLTLEFSKHKEHSGIDTGTISVLANIISDGIQELPDVLPF